MSIQRLSNAGQSGYRYKTLIAGITPVPSVPVIGTATALTFSTASVEFTAPGAYAGSTYTATSSPGGLTGTSASSPITISGLSENTAYTFTVTATNATGTSGASAASNSITTPSAFTPESGYDSLATVTVGSGGTSSILFTGIPTGYKHLQVRWLARDTGNSLAYARMRFNSDTGSNYAYHTLYGDGASVATDTGINQTYGVAGVEGGSANVFAANVLDILDYANTNKFKTTRVINGVDVNGSGGYVEFTSSLWRSTNAITSINIYTQDNLFSQYSQFALYGIK
jgi:hypothetical protein